MRDLDHHLIHGSLSLHEAHSPNGISIGSAVFAGPTTVTDRQAILLGQQQYAASLSIAMRPDNNIENNTSFYYTYC